jgi:hypothetical protein
MHGRIVAILLAGCLGYAVSPIASADPSRIALLPTATVPGDAILLANLLPTGVSEKLRDAAGVISLGKSPQIGSLRHLRGDAVAEAIFRGGLLPAEFLIPEEIAIWREDRPLTGEEILSCVRRALWRFSLSPQEQQALLALRAEDVRGVAGLRVPPGSARLQVQEIFVDLVSRQARFRLAADSQPRSVPFEALATLPEHNLFPASAGSVTLAAAGSLHGAGSDADGAKAPVLIAAGQSARLWLHSENSSIVVDVKALQAGRAGELIRVRLPLGGNILRARVTGAQQLDAIF